VAILVVHFATVFVVHQGFARPVFHTTALGAVVILGTKNLVVDEIHGGEPVTGSVIRISFTFQPVLALDQVDVVKVDIGLTALVLIEYRAPTGTGDACALVEFENYRALTTAGK
jgi:hypothetical protein